MVEQFTSHLYGKSDEWGCCIRKRNYDYKLESSYLIASLESDKICKDFH